MSYLENIISRYRPNASAPTLVTPLANALRSRAGVEDIRFSGSYAKGTAVRVGSSGSDVDLFITFSPAAYTLLGAYEDIFSFAQSNGLSPRRQNVSIGISYNGVNVDLVPARRQEGYTHRHSLYVRKTNTWTQTNVNEHVKLVSGSSRLQEIKLGKIWRRLHNLDFPAFYLELIFIEALKYKRTGSIGENFQSALRYVAINIESTKVLDPSNTNNIISNSLTYTQKSSIAQAAQQAVDATTWSAVVW